MALQPRSQLELYNIFKNEVQIVNEKLTDFKEGSINDSVGGATSVSASELVSLITDLFAKTFFGSANGPEVTGGADDLQNLAVDRFGDDFARPGATESIGIANFSRPTTNAGDVLIPAGTIVKTPTDANGESIRFKTVLSVTMTGLSVNASIEAFEAGTSGNKEADTITVIESALTDASIIVNNDEATTGGEPEEDDATYRETINNKIVQLAGATCPAIQAKLEEVPGIEKATVKSYPMTVIEWDDSLQQPIGSSFTLPRVRAYIADANGTGSQALLDAADVAIEDSKGCGIEIFVEAATPLSFNWSATIVLDPGGPNYAELQSDTTKIVNSMFKYLEDMEIGSDFIRTAANSYILSVWGPSGTGDLVAGGFTTQNPTGDVETDDNERLVPNTLEIV